MIDKNKDTTQYKKPSVFLNSEVRNRKRDLSVKQVITSLCRVNAWKYTDLANAVGICRQSLNNYMNGSWAVPSDIKIKIAKALNVDSAVIWDLK